ncbi:MAG TPA: beta-N-acetylhexosaminidase [Chitinophagaceae bacterium]|jgi:hexosaminidase|nr:beta-N-acetylhexosaminidase [Chitinophagaceae bacterium]
MKSLIAIACVFAYVSVFSQQVNIIPQPAEMKIGKGFLTIKQPVGFIYNDDVPHDYGATFFKDYLKKNYRISQFEYGSEHSYGLPTEIFIDYSPDASLKDQYELTVDEKGIYVHGNEKGLFYAFQTLIQLLPAPIPNSLPGRPAGKIQIPFVSIKDYPRFSYRGMHLDVGRHFFPVSFIKKYIDYLALHKMNYFHWHLTEDQGWRIEIKKYPQLTKVGAWRNGTIIGRFPGTGNDGIRYGGFYTQNEIKEVVAYASKRYITVIPEIEMPGHCSAAIASYPWLSCFPGEPTIKYFPKQCAWYGDSTGKQVQQTWGVFEDVYCAGKDSTFKFLQDVLDEVMALFPSKYIHVGGDECPKANWKRCPLCQKRIKDEHLKDEHELQSYFIQRMEKYLNSKGRTLIGWDEILEGGLAPNAVVMSWRGESGGIAAARQKHNVIMTPGGWVYFDHSQTQNEDSVTIGGYTPVEKTYSYNPIPDSLTKEQGKYILGAQGNVWTEYMKNEKKVEYMIFPRMASLSEVLWSKKKDSADFEKRLLTQFKRYDLWKANYSKAYFDLKATVLPTADYDGILWKLENKNSEYKIVYLNGLEDNASQKYTEAIRVMPIEPPPTYSARLENSKGEAVSNWLIQKFHINKATGKKLTLTTPPSQNYPGDGAFTLVNGVQNEKGLLRSREFLGFNGTDCEALIDLGSVQQISNVKAHIFEQTPSWIWRPKFFQVLISPDNNTYTEMGISDEVQFNDSTKRNGIMIVQQKSVATRYIKIKLGNYGPIPEGNPGAGNKPWLFVDEIEVN